ncbi:hypothetical protein SAMN05660359_03519 [Geodermatophilus obscurus]|uniref:Uncharacterized protein n=1 Tax=Geodermatophilus obscurus TaxID=1861 RepID=A0A1I5H856_9ACTN|nr:hypothetical protein [Geodermatophilus obscurus]SFO44186.1 hypothetical protein SAMN05660359_03519 [Geodermatophilus obscurus]
MDTALRPIVPPLPSLPSLARLPDGQTDAAQDFVNRLRAAAPRFAAAAGADSAVVREVVPPARHRRARCRVVLRAADGSERDLTFLGPVSRAAALADRAFASTIQQWLDTRHDDEGAGLVPDDEAPGGHAVDLTAWTPPTAVSALPTAVVPAVAAGSLPTTAMPLASLAGRSPHAAVPAARGGDLPTEAITVAPVAG